MRGVSMLLQPELEEGGEGEEEESDEQVREKAEQKAIEEQFRAALARPADRRPVAHPRASGVPRWKDFVEDGTSEPSLGNPSASVLEHTLAFRRKAEVRSCDPRIRFAPQHACLSG